MNIREYGTGVGIKKQDEQSKECFHELKFRVEVSKLQHKHQAYNLSELHVVNSSLQL